MGRSGALLTPEEVRSYREEGFVRIDRPVLAATALVEVGKQLDTLFARYEGLPRGFAQDLDVGAERNGRPRIPEVNFTTVLKPRLSHSQVVRVCTAIAQQLHGPRAHLVFDHAIYKPACNGAATAWHQDIAYAKPGEQIVGCWVPLQSVGPEEGCMRYVPGSHLGGPVAHERVPSATNPRILAAQPDDDQVVYAPVKAGGLVVHNVMTLHSTGPNDGGATRRVWVLNFGIGPHTDNALSRTVRSAKVRTGIMLHRGGG